MRIEQEMVVDGGRVGQRVETITTKRKKRSPIVLSVSLVASVSGKTKESSK